MGSSPIHRRGLPVELMNELFGSLPLKNSFRLLTKLSNGLLAKNVSKMITGMRQATKNNKLNEQDCGPKLAIIADGLGAKHSGLLEYNSVRTILPIPPLMNCVTNPTIIFYVEAEIIQNLSNGVIIGFCQQEFSMDWMLGFDGNSIGIWDKSGIFVDGISHKFKTSGDFLESDVVGLGIVQQPNSVIEIFATGNGKLLGKKKLAQTFVNVTLFPAVTLAGAGESIRVNFGKNKWSFTEFNNVIDE